MEAAEVASKRSKHDGFQRAADDLAEREENCAEWEENLTKRCVQDPESRNDDSSDEEVQDEDIHMQQHEQVPEQRDDIVDNANVIEATPTQSQVKDPSDDELDDDTEPVDPTLICADLAQGAESQPIPVYNAHNDARIPASFRYLRTSVLQTTGARELAEQGTQAMRSRGFDICARKRHKGIGPYRFNRTLKKFDTDGILECGAVCSSNQQCAATRVVSQGLTLPLYIKHTGTDRGFGVKCSRGILRNGFIAHYTGLGMTDSEAEQLRCQDAYLFGLDSFVGQHHAARQSTEDVDASRLPVVPETAIEAWSDDLRYLKLKEDDLPTPSPLKHKTHESHIVLDAQNAGNVARFVNHSCKPNCRMQAVLTEGDNGLWYKPALFAMTNIKADTEITYDYQYEVGSSAEALDCNCGARNCRGRFK
ncbi:hypothetical protein WJX73_005877 [Symbiochloris irregularis]|uniref:SET domain-containing protein n=1 Tax=Symbiochloris irregularis TaxID=706552 RepID=A0AAW1NUR4_9CHLO